MAIKGAIPVRFEDVFPYGAFALTVEPVRDFDKSTSTSPVQARDRETGELVWSINVTDVDPEARQPQLKVKVAAPVQPVLPDAAPGVPFRPVEFDGLSITAYVNGSGRVAYSYRARAVRAPGASAGKAATTGKAA